jgi:hypothetical protein
MSSKTARRRAAAHCPAYYQQKKPELMRALRPFPRMNNCVGDAINVCFFGSIPHCPFLGEKVLSKKFFSVAPCEIGRILRER